jgi:hypothetical protein
VSSSGLCENLWTLRQPDVDEEEAGTTSATLSMVTSWWWQTVARGGASLANGSEGEGVRKVCHTLEQLKEEIGREGLIINNEFRWEGGGDTVHQWQGK